MKLNACAKHKESNRHYIKLFLQLGWELDRFGHMKRETNGRTYRIKFQHHTIRKEILLRHDTGSVKSEWVRLATYKYIDHSKDTKST